MPYMEMFHSTASEFKIWANFSKVKSFFELTLASGLFVCAWIQTSSCGTRTRFGIFTEIGLRLRVGGSSFVCVAALANACLVAYFENLSRFGRHISFAWFDSNLLQQVSVAVVQISDRKESWSAARPQYFEFVIVARKYFLSRP